MNHELKVLPQFFKALWCGDKTFEIRKNDRNFEERDEITLIEKADGYEHTGFTGREKAAEIAETTWQADRVLNNACRDAAERIRNMTGDEQWRFVWRS